MNTEENTQHLRRLNGELGAEEAAVFDERLQKDRAFAQRFESIKCHWESLELPPPPQPDRYAATRWLATERAQRSGSWLGSRLASGTVLAAGLVLGLGLGWTVGAEEPIETSPEILVATSLSEESSTLADSYWSLVTAELEAQ